MSKYVSHWGVVITTIYILSLKKGKRSRKIKYRKHFHKGRYDMRDYIAKIGWSNILKKCVPLKKQEKRSKKKHFSKEAIQKIKYKQMIWKIYKHIGNEEDHAIYKEAFN